MSNCPPYQATELTDLLFNCDTFELIVIQTAANGDETLVSTNLSCILDGKNPVVDVRAECVDKTLVFEFEDGRLLIIDMACLDTYVTWTENLNGSVTLISASGEYTVDVMSACKDIEQIFDVPEENNIVMCDVEGKAVKAPIRNVIESITLNYTQFIDGHGTTLKGEGTLVNPYQVDLEVCELELVDYNQQGLVAACIEKVGESPGRTVSMPAIKAGEGVTIQNTGRLDVNFCDKPEIPYDVDAKHLVCQGSGTKRMPVLQAGENVVIDEDGSINVPFDEPDNICASTQINYNSAAEDLVCLNGFSRRMPAINAGTNVTIDSNGKLSANFTAPPTNPNQRIGVVVLSNHDVGGSGTRYPSSINFQFQNDPYDFISISSNWVLFRGSGLVTATYQSGTKSRSGYWVGGKTETSVAGLPNIADGYPNDEFISDNAPKNVHASTLMMRVRSGDRIRFGGWSSSSVTMSMGEAVISFIED